jgi:hypothetical protein
LAAQQLRNFVGVLIVARGGKFFLVSRQADVANPTNFTFLLPEIPHQLLAAADVGFYVPDGRLDAGEVPFFAKLVGRQVNT